MLRRLLRGEVPIQKRELEQLRTRAAEAQDYIGAVRGERLQAIRQRAMRIRRMDDPSELSAINAAWAQGVADYENALGEALLDELRRRS